MAATYEQVEAALLAPFVAIADGGLSEWTATQYVAFENVDFDTNDFSGNPWVYVEVNGGARTTQTVGFEYRGNPTVTVSAHIPMGWGKAPARAIIDAAIAIYDGRKFTVGNSTIVPYSFSRPVQIPSDGWYKLAVQISFNQF